MKKILLITGATSGIGKVAANAFANAGHTLIFTARDETKAQECKAEFIALSGNTDVHYILCNLASLKCVQETANIFKSQITHLDVLINNAGVWEMEYKESEDRIEMNFAVNHLAPFLLTLSLLDWLKKSNTGRIITTSSMAHRRNILQLDDLEFKHTPYNGTASYSQSKLCNLLFTLQLAKGLDGANITANAVHPGWANSSLFKNFENYQAKGDTPEEGARATIYTALRDEVNNFSGKFFFKEHIEEATEMAKDEKLAKALWDKSIEYVSAYL